MAERHRRQRPCAVDHITREKLGGEVLRVGGAAAVAGNQQLAAGAQRAFDRLRDRGDQAQKRAILRCVLQGGQRPVEKAGDKIVVLRRASHVPSLSMGRKKLTAQNLPNKITFRRKSMQRIKA